MKASRKLSRRSFAASVLGGVVIGGGATALLVGRANAQTYTGVTDSDTGEHADRPGYGRGVRNQHTDTDTGPNADRQFHGRGPYMGSQGSYEESATGCSDRDGGPGSDPGGRGRHCAGAHEPWPRNYQPTHTRHCSDSDSGNNADLMQQGRHC